MEFYHGVPFSNIAVVGSNYLESDSFVGVDQTAHAALLREGYQKVAVVRASYKLHLW